MVSAFNTTDAVATKQGGSDTRLQKQYQKRLQKQDATRALPEGKKVEMPTTAQLATKQGV